MTNPRPENKETTDAISSIANETMRKGGMSTVKIMKALFEANIALNNIAGADMSKSGSVINQAIALDGQTARLREKLGKEYKFAVEHLINLATSTQDNITNLSTVKTAVQIAANYNSQVTPILNSSHELNEKREATRKALDAFIEPMRKAFQALSNEITGSVPNAAQKKEMEHLMVELRKMDKQAKSDFEGKSIESLRDKLISLHNEVAKTTAASGVPVSTPSEKPKQA